MNSVTLEMIRAASASIKGVRWALLVSITASIVTFISAYNTIESGWYTKRMIQYSLSSQWCTQCNSDSTSKNLCDCLKKSYPDKSLSNFEKSLKKWLEAENSSGKLNCESACLKAGLYAEFMTQRRFETIYTVQIPWFGVEFDINDLGIISGFFLSIIMLVLTYNLGLKYSNLDKLFQYLNGIDDLNQRKNAYDLLSFSQILKLPNGRVRDFTPIVLYWVPYILFCLPILVHSFVLYNDLTTIKYIISIDSDTWITTLVAALFWLLIGSLTITTIRIDIHTDKLWDQFEEKNDM